MSVVASRLMSASSGKLELDISGCLFDAQRVVDLCRSKLQIARSLFDAEFAGDIFKFCITGCGADIG